ncbi:LysR family transcriptional regulator [Nitratireductor aestuarii]|uniref:LysR family transcriptional regulator n=1 Tax=Nitratireductor aestuarii TaxID=1735103 RepID=A0A916VY49_9HYPH|nr:LysR substrate-binding domain-containing protein [Nitratireductor aestuarii]GGA51310.1 LysR family transcriptional regulator [Nitratireductor aestuarii]
MIIMKRPYLPPLPSLRAFEAAARLSSFKDAAAELSVTPTAISHQIRQLETFLGRRVLNRSPRSVKLTPEGLLLFDVVGTSLDQIAAVTRRVIEQGEPSALTVSSTSAFLNHWLVPRLAELWDSQPDLELRLHVSDQIAVLRAGEVDIAIRYGSGPYADPSVPLCKDVFLPVCSPSLSIATLSDLQNAPLLHVDGRLRPAPSPGWDRWFREAGLDTVSARAGQHFPDSTLAVQAALAGRGVALLSRVLVADALESGLLVAPFSNLLPGDSYHFVCAKTLAERPDVVRLRNWFQAALADGTSPS